MKLIVALPFLLLSMFPFQCGQFAPNATPNTSTLLKETEILEAQNIKVGAARFDQYLHLIEGKEVALVVNQTSMVEDEHLVDTLIRRGISIQKIFAPEHGFRGTADAGEKLKDGNDPRTGIPIASLYGKKRKPAAEDLENIDIVIFDIQDVGARFYTYISTMHYMMEACAENDKSIIVLDRPNPNGHYVDGPLLDPTFQSFVGMHPIPVVHGLTIGELANMINAEGWLGAGLQCELTVVTCLNYQHNKKYSLPVKPSPNLPNERSIELYPSLCFFEGTTWSIGRGTEMQFQVLGHPDHASKAKFSFTPLSGAGSKYPKHEGQVCRGYDLRKRNTDLVEFEDQINLHWLVYAYQQTEKKDQFFLENNFIDKLAGTDQLRKQIIDGKSAKEIRRLWKKEITAYKELRKPYLLYKDFE